jgi:hypothetical protein
LPTLPAQGFLYVKYNNAQSAHQAIEHLNGAEFPPGSGFSLKVQHPCFQITWSTWQSLNLYIGMHHTLNLCSGILHMQWTPLISLLLNGIVY